jgi:predicted glycogen debranching enzyme
VIVSRKATCGFPAITSQAYSPGVLSPDGARWLEGFSSEPWPRWRFKLGDGTELTQEIFCVEGAPVTAVRIRLTSELKRAVLRLRPFFSGRDHHALMAENPEFRFEPEGAGHSMLFRPYGSLPGVIVRTNGAFSQQAHWYRNFLYAVERERGLDHVEDLASPGVFRFNLAKEEAAFILSADTREGRAAMVSAPATDWMRALLESRRRRYQKLDSRLHRAADAFIVRRGRGKTIVAGYPWFTDWGRDTFISLRGLCLATGRLDDAKAILLEWSGAVSEGMLPNRFTDHGEAPEYNSVDASLWFVIAACELLALSGAGRVKLTPEESATLTGAADSVLEGYAGGTRHGIRKDADGLLCAGEPGVQLTWMDAKVADRVITPRTGKAVEVQALWVNALLLSGVRRAGWAELGERAKASFAARFWNESAGCLYDVVDVDHEKGRADASLRPNQIFAAGGLPVCLLDDERARKVVDVVESRLVTPLGLRTLDPSDPSYVGRYEGGPAARDGAYHQGTVWPWLMGPFVEAWVRSRGGTASAKKAAREKFLEPLLAHLGDAGLGHVSEIADGDAPHAPRGCPFQAWSVGEVLRLTLGVLSDGARARKGRQG